MLQLAPCNTDLFSFHNQSTLPSPLEGAIILIQEHVEPSDLNNYLPFTLNSESLKVFETFNFEQLRPLFESERFGSRNSTRTTSRHLTFLVRCTQWNLTRSCQMLLKPSTKFGTKVWCWNCFPSSSIRLSYRGLRANSVSGITLSKSIGFSQLSLGILAVRQNSFLVSILFLLFVGDPLTPAYHPLRCFVIVHYSSSYFTTHHHRR